MDIISHRRVNLLKASTQTIVCLCFTSLQQRSHIETAPHLLSLAKDVELGKYTVPTGNRTPGRRVAVHYATAAPRKLHPHKRIQRFIYFSVNHILMQIDSYIFHSSVTERIACTIRTPHDPGLHIVCYHDSILHSVRFVYGKWFLGRVKLTTIRMGSFGFQIIAVRFTAMNSKATGQFCGICKGAFTNRSRAPYGV